MKKKLFYITLLIILILSFITIPVSANDSKKDKDYRIGDKVALETGEEATYIGKNEDGEDTWQVVFGDPVYIPGTNIKYDCTWTYINNKYTAGENSFEAIVTNDSVTVNYKGESSSWSPSFNLGKQQKSSLKVELLYTDPVNNNYHNNTLKWNYGNGISRYLRIIEGMLIEYYVIEKEQNSDIIIQNNTVNTSGFIYHRDAFAYDAEGNPIELTQDNKHNLTLNIDKNDNKLKVRDNESSNKDAKKDAVYPITIDPDVTVYTSSSDGFVAWSYTYNWATTRTMSSADYALSNSNYFYVSSEIDDGDATIERSAVYFDTSAIPDDVTLSNAVLYLYLVSLYEDDDAGTYIVNGMPTYPHNPLVIGDFNYTNYGSFSSNYGYYTSPSTGSYNQINVNNSTALKGIINKTGYTNLFLVERRDYENDTPSEGTENRLTYYSYEKGSGYRPKLVLTYSASAPVITSVAASNIAYTSARLNSLIVTDGYESCRIRFGYGTTTKAEEDFEDYDTVTEWSDYEYTSGEHPYVDIESLVSGETYYFRVQIENTTQSGTSDELTFDTLESLGKPTDFKAYPSSTSISLSWTKGYGASQTMIRVSYDTYPTDDADGYLVYIGIESTTTHTNLLSGHTYYYSAFSESGGSYTIDYATVAMTTLSYSSSEEDIDAPDSVPGWMQETDYTNLDGLEPFYSTTNNFIDSIGMPRAQGWMSLILLVIAVITTFVMIKTGFVGGFIVLLVLLIIAGGAKQIPTYMIALTLIAGIGIWALTHGGGHSE